MESLVFDLIILAVVLLFAWLGSRRGLILSFCSLIAVIVGLVGGSIAADYLTPPLVEQIAPMVEGVLAEQISSGALALSGSEGFIGDLATQLYESQVWQAEGSAFPHALSLVVTKAVIRPVVFLLAFIVVLILWYFISHALDLVARLPVLSTLNAAGGFLFGAAEGVLLLMLAFLLIRHFKPELIPAAAMEGSRILKLLEQAPALF